MKRILSIVLTLIMALAIFAGCKDKTPEPAVTGAPPASDTAAPPDTGPADTEEYTLEREEGCNLLTFYWYGEGVDYSKCDMWIWYPDADGRGYLFHPCGYGVKVMLNVPEEVTEVGFIVRKNCSAPGGTSWGDATKDYDGDRFAVITGPETEVYLKPGEAAQYQSDDGGKTLYQAKKLSLAGIVALDQIKYVLSPATRFTSLDQIKVLDGERELEVTGLSSLDNEVVMGTITVGEKLDVSKTYTVKLDGFEPINAIPTEVFDSPEFIEKYTYDGDDLGATVDGADTVFKLWAPTADKVQLKLFETGSGGEAYQTIDMEKGDRGVWSLTVSCGHGVYYTYLVTTALGTNEAVDPYARAAGVNGDRGMVVDLKKTDPDGFENDKYYSDLKAYNEAIIWEVHVRDFSNKIAGSKYPGKYLAFTEKGLTNSSGQPAGLDYLTDLGVTHVHLQPVYDYATVDESSDKPQFNWGYDPKNYNVPEGSYSTDPANGEVRINEFKQMVASLHENGMGVVMDVVYNHTYSADSNLERTVPYYYYRYDGTGKLSNGSGCGNETASERKMFRKYIVDSVSYWAKEYHIDGFRFDLMALHDVETMQAVETAVHKINPNAIIYGEGWTGGATPLRANLQATQANIRQITPTEGGIGAVAVFNDAIRDGLKGSVFDEKDQGYINGKPTKSNVEKVIFGINGGKKSNTVSWSVDNNMVINYMGCHDNHTLWDKLQKSNPDASDEERFEMNRLGAAVVMISKGTPFFLAGEEMLRTKGGDHNSYASSDEVNNINWDALTDGSLVFKMRGFYRDLIKMRKAYSFFTEAEVSCEAIPNGNGAIEVTWTEGERIVAVAVINPDADPIDYKLPDGEWLYLLAKDGCDPETKAAAPEILSTPGRTVEIVAAKG
ncbi:MAG: type I pullulanase [Clostridia bacterium]|nr:type I pullulanase [Clostridia bacterium]